MRSAYRKVQEIRLEPLPLAIVKLARSYWEADGFPAGSNRRHWLRAEAEVLAARGLPHPDGPLLASWIFMGSSPSRGTDGL
jgi:hypothetical protein